VRAREEVGDTVKTEGETKARMPWHGDIAHTVLSDGRKVLRGSEEEARHKYGDK
jgi:hypothetical protein